MRDPEASESFNLEPGSTELDRVFAGCDADRATYLGHCARFLAYTGAHISVLAGGLQVVTHIDEDGQPSKEEVYHDPIRSDAVRGGFVYWRRPKNQKPIGMPLSRRIKDWIVEFLDAPRPLTRGRYNQLFDRVGERVQLQVNPLRFRHTCAVLLFHVNGLDAPTVQRLLGVTPEVMTAYVIKPAWMTARYLADRDF